MIDPVLKDIKRRMDGAMESLRGDLAGLRTGRASTGLRTDNGELAHNPRTRSSNSGAERAC